MELLSGGRNIFETNNSSGSTGSNASSHSDSSQNLDAFTCPLEHSLVRHTSTVGGCCDVRNGQTICSEMWERGETAEVWACFECNFWACLDCYNDQCELLREKNARKERRLNKQNVRGSTTKTKTKTKKMVGVPCRKPEFALAVMEATIFSFNSWFKARNIPLDETAWQFSEHMPPELKDCLEISHASKHVNKLLDREEIKIVVDTETDTIEKRAKSYNEDFDLDKESIDKLRSGGDAMLFALVHLNISYEGWDYRLGMIKMYDGIEILTLSCENKYVFMGTDAFDNIWVRYFIPDTSYNVIIAYLEKDYNYYALVKEYSQVDNLTLDLDNKYKGVRFFPLSGKVTNDSMGYMLGANNDGHTLEGTQVEGKFGVTGASMMTLNVTAVTVMSMRSCGGPKRTDVNGFVDFFNEFKDTNCMLAVYSGKKMLHSAVYNESNRSE